MTVGGVEFNAGLVSKLRSYLQAKDEPNYVWSRELDVFSNVTGCRGVWDMAAFNSNGDAVDVSGNGKLLTMVSGPSLGLYNYAGLRSYVFTTDIRGPLSRADEADLDITGLEAFVSNKGLAMMGWWQARSVPLVSNDQGLMAKWYSLTNDRSYALYIPVNTTTIRFSVSIDGTAVTTVDSSVAAVQQSSGSDPFFFVAALFDPSTSLEIFVNGTWDENTTSIPASIYNSVADFNINSMENGGVNLVGLCGIGGLYSAYIGRTFVESVYEQTKHLYGVR